MRKFIFVLIAMSMMIAQSSKTADAAWLVNGIWFSNVCRADANSNFYWVYPPQEAEPVGSACAFPDGTPGIVSPN